MEARRADAERATTISRGGERYLAFEVLGRRYGLPLRAVREIVRAEATRPATGRSKAFLGLTALRGTALPVLDAALLLGAERPIEPDAASCFVVLESRAGGALVGLLVERLVGTFALEGGGVDTSLPPPQHGTPAAVVGLARSGDSLCVLLDIAELLAAERVDRFFSHDLDSQLTAAARAAATEQLLLVEVEGAQLGLRLSEVERIAPCSSLSIPSAAPPGLATTALGDGLVAVLEAVRATADCDPAPPREGGVMIVPRANPRLAFRVDSTGAILRLDRAAVAPREDGRTRVVVTGEGPLELADLATWLASSAAREAARWIRTVATIDHIASRGTRQRERTLEAERRRQAESPEAALAGAYLIVESGGQSIGLSGRRVIEVVPDRGGLVPLPRARADVAGVLDLRRSTYLVVDLRERLGLGPPGGAEHPCIVLVQRDGGGAVGLLVEGVVGWRRYEPQDVCGPESTTLEIHPDLVLAVARREGTAETNLLDAVKLVADDRLPYRTEMLGLAAPRAVDG